MRQRMKLLVVEDEAGIADFLRRGLESEGYAVEWAADGEDGEARALSGDFDLILLDVMLPGRDGLEILASVRRSFPALPVILLTARGEVEDRVRGLDSGATDYVTKPFSFDELAARVRAHLRQTEPDHPTRIEVGDIRIDLLRRQVRRDGAEIRLSATEFDLLAFLARQPGQVLARERILKAVWGYDFDPGTNVLGVYVGYLRKKLARSGRPAPIETIRSVGYRLRASA
jgi:two-component system, OmpR family, response regulator